MIAPVAMWALPRFQCATAAQHRAGYREDGHEDDGLRAQVHVAAVLSATAGRACSSRLDAAQWLSRGTKVCATFWNCTAGFSTMPSESWSTIERWISCQGVWLAG